jgi:hypothetical protein
MMTRQNSTGRRRGFFSRWRRAIRAIAVGLAAFAVLGLRLSAPNAEGNLATEQADTARLLQDMLTIQRRYAADQNRPLARGTHAKGTCAKAEFTINDLASTLPDRALATRLAHGIYARPATYPANIRFANGESHIFADSHPDVRAMSFSADLTGPTADALGVARQDFSLNNATTFPLNDAHEFAVATQVAMPASSSTSTSPSTRPRTPSRSAASTAPAGPPSLPAGRRAWGSSRVGLGHEKPVVFGAQQT